MLAEASRVAAGRCFGWTNGAPVPTILDMARGTLLRTSLVFPIALVAVTQHSSVLVALFESLQQIHQTTHAVVVVIITIIIIR